MSCGRKATQADATKALQQSFKAAAPEVRQAIQVVNTHLQAKDYTAAAKALAPVVVQQRLTEPEKQAVGVALEQINQAIAASPPIGRSIRRRCTNCGPGCSKPSTTAARGFRASLRSQRGEGERPREP